MARSAASTGEWKSTAGQGKVMGTTIWTKEMDFTSEIDCVLFIARTSASADYTLSINSCQSALDNAKAIKALCAPILNKYGVSVSFTDRLYQGQTATVQWSTGDTTYLGDEPVKWSDQLPSGSWQGSPLQRDFAKALARLKE